MKSYLNQITKNFIMKEGISPDVSAALQVVREMITSVKPSSKKDGNRIKVALEQLNNVRRQVRKLHETINKLEEQLEVLQEKKE